MANRGTPTESLGEAMQRVYPELAAVATAASDPVYLVGGAVRDLLLGRGRADIDLAVVGDPVDLASALGAATLSEHARFATAKVELDGHRIDIAATRTETYPHPGALPVVSPADGIEGDLGRRDFSVNAMAVELTSPGELIDPHGGLADLHAGVLRVLHADSFRDDPTRAIRAARYSSRFGFGLEPKTEALLRATDLDTVSDDRAWAELLRLAAETQASLGFELLSRWGLLELREGATELADAAIGLLGSPPWQGQASAPQTVLAAVLGPLAAAREIAAASPERPSEAVDLARGRDPVDLALARAMGAKWLDEYVSDWRRVELEIDGRDLLAAGVPEGPAIGRGLAEALRMKLDGEAAGREAELAAALAAARGAS